MKWRVSSGIWLVVLFAGVSGFFTSQSDNKKSVVSSTVKDMHEAIPLRATNAQLRAQDLDRRSLPDGDINPFKAVNFTPPPSPPQPMPIVAPAPPVALVQPPFPFHYFGRMTDPEGKLLVYLIRDETLILVKEGDEVEGSYHVDIVSDKEIIITYTPLGTHNVINIRSAE